MPRAPQTQTVLSMCQGAREPAFHKSHVGTRSFEQPKAKQKLERAGPLFTVLLLCLRVVSQESIAAGLIYNLEDPARASPGG